MSTPDPAVYPSTYYVELSPTEHGQALVASSPNLVIGVPEPIDGQIAGWVVQVPPVAGGWEIAEGAVAAHLYALSRGEPGDPNVTQVHPTSEPEVRGYVVMSKGGSGEPLLAYLDLHRTRERAEHVAETLRDGAAYGLPADPEAHVGVVTALPARTEGDTTP